MIGRYILDEAGQPVECPDLMTWARWMEENADGPARIVARTTFPELKAAVSTVFLGLDHSFRPSSVGPPVLFESMLFVENLAGEEMRRYSTREEAEAGHREMVEAFIEKKRKERALKGIRLQLTKTDEAIS